MVRRILPALLGLILGCSTLSRERAGNVLVSGAVGAVAVDSVFGIWALTHVPDILNDNQAADYRNGILKPTGILLGTAVLMAVAGAILWDIDPHPSDVQTIRGNTHTATVSVQ